MVRMIFDLKNNEDQIEGKRVESRGWGVVKACFPLRPNIAQLCGFGRGRE